MQVFPLKCQMQKVMQQFSELATKFMYFETEKLKVERFHMLLTIFHKGTLSHGIVENRMKDGQRQIHFHISSKRGLAAFTSQERSYKRSRTHLFFMGCQEFKVSQNFTDFRLFFLTQTLMFMRSHLFIAELQAGFLQFQHLMVVFSKSRHKITYSICRLPESAIYFSDY